MRTLEVIRLTPWTRRTAAAIGLLLSISLAGLGGPDLSDGVSVLFVLSEPYGANTGLLFHNLERLGWDVTIAGTKETISYCSAVCTDIDVDVTLAGIDDLAPYDALVIAPMPGAFRSVPFPAEDLRTNEHALNLIREANQQGLTLYGGCAGLLVLGDAGILEGRSVVSHNAVRVDCRTYGAQCARGGFTRPPVIDGNLVTGTNQRYFALEIPEAIAHALDTNLHFEPSLDSLKIEELALRRKSIELQEPVTDAWTLGLGRSDGALAVCPLGDGVAIVGYTYSAGAGAGDLLVARLDADGSPIWARSIGGPGREVGNAICTTHDAALIVAGTTTSAGAGQEDILLAKLDIDGNVLRIHTYGGEGPDLGAGVCTTHDNGLAVCGTTHSFGAERSDLFVLRTDAAGNELWTARAGGRLYDRGHAIREDAEGRLWVAGGTASAGSGNYDMLLVTFSPSGELLREVTYGRAQYDIAEDLVFAANGDVLVTGYGDQEGSDPNDVCVVRFDAEGTQLWARRIRNRKSFDYGQAVLELDGGDLLVCGALTSPGTTQSDAWLLRLDAEGQEIWTQNVGNLDENEWASGMVRLSSGEIVVVGSTRSHGAGGSDVLLLLIDPD